MEVAIALMEKILGWINSVFRVPKKLSALRLLYFQNFGFLAAFGDPQRKRRLESQESIISLPKSIVY
jgi:hypothetical protein